jgi:hypothetical protein
VTQKMAECVARHHFDGIYSHFPKAAMSFYCHPIRKPQSCFTEIVPLNQSEGIIY